ncbi:protein TolQ [Psychrobium sp. 1_MG-2023]|uniref:protein TolQ n=1 Tax=Psychrobium sp. 1_MG-2023 TaxID=3062624 RepID=UPI000C32BFC2|nr:protein TolQ [Psychrobium sp. 1_MG-2023]MDP2560251.1 protein TolQ [Psychrobium sp. 1_MG-2023]PKF57061.1 protein TolQ [Alteromonadales bacterium alter-6D02]
MTAELSFIDLLLEASVLVQLVMLALLLASIFSWAVIFQRRTVLNQATSSLRKFEDRFWSGTDLAGIYKELSARGNKNLGPELMFCAGFKEFAKLRQSASSTPDAIVTGSHRAMRVVLSREIDRLEQNLPFLATVGSISPYVGLFGTVWGIMNSFIALGAVQQATLQMVAPGIAEALIATAMGLFAAIPAVIAYNKFSNSVDKLENSYANFMEEFASILQREAYANQNKAG